MDGRSHTVKGGYEKGGIWRNRSSPFQISNNLKESPTILTVISYCLKSFKISYENGLCFCKDIL